MLVDLKILPEFIDERKHKEDLLLLIPDVLILVDLQTSIFDPSSDLLHEHRDREFFIL